MLERWFITSHHDDEKGVMASGGAGVLTAVALDLALAAYARWAYRRWREIYPPVSPTPET